jgi:hypothetical protein
VEDDIEKKEKKEKKRKNQKLVRPWESNPGRPDYGP